MADDLPESLFAILRADIANVASRLDKLVSTDVFAAEQKRRDEQIAGVVQDLADERIARAEAIAAEKIAREAAIRHERDARLQAHAETDKRSKNAWAGVRWTIATVLTAGGVLAAYLAIVWR